MPHGGTVCATPAASRNDRAPVPCPSRVRTIGAPLWRSLELSPWPTSVAHGTPTAPLVDDPHVAPAVVHGGLDAYGTHAALTLARVAQPWTTQSRCCADALCRLDLMTTARPRPDTRQWAVLLST